MWIPEGVEVSPRGWSVIDLGPVNSPMYAPTRGEVPTHRAGRMGSTPHPRLSEKL
jgi:hypothetical protein